MKLFKVIIYIQEDEKYECILEKTYAVYEGELKNRENRPKLMGKFICK